jgi:hypothetical protein
MSPSRTWLQRVQSKPRLLVVLSIGAILLVAGIRVQQWRSDPHVYLLEDESAAKWIRSHESFSLGTHEGTYLYYRPMITVFRCDFELSEPISEASLSVQAFRRCLVWLDADPQSSMPLYSSGDDLDSWKTHHKIRVPRLSAGAHQLSILVVNQAAYPCLLASCPELRVYSGRHWKTSGSERNWTPAVLASDPPSNVPAQVQAAGYTNVLASFRRVWPWLALIVGTSFAWTWWNAKMSRQATVQQFWSMSPNRLRWLVMAAWLVMAVNNIWRIPAAMGFDIDYHLAYVAYVVEHHKVPLANDGWQMFQAPMLYLVAAPWYALFSSLFGVDSCAKWLRFIPLLCGLAQIEIVYRTARAVFPERDDPQMVATAVGGLMPMNIYMSQVFGNEPLAGCLASLVVLMCLSLLAQPLRSRNRWLFLIVGVLWGLAMLAKVTALLLAPLIMVVTVFHAWSHAAYAGSWRQRFLNSGATFGGCFVIAGWYYLRNWIVFGKPFVGGWDPIRGILWWQDPGYRTWNQLACFGSSLDRPIYSGVYSFWDSIYSSMWMDGNLSGSLMPADEAPWKIDWMQIAAWLSIVPTVCILAGVARLGSADLRAARGCLVLAAAAIAIHLAAIFDLYVQVPIYSAAKASYTLGLLPCFAILAAAGSGPLLRFRLLRATFFAALTCWAMAVYLAYFCAL